MITKSYRITEEGEAEDAILLSRDSSRELDAFYVTDENTGHSVSMTCYQLRQLALAIKEITEGV